MTDYISQIDTRRFGFKIARINDATRLMTAGFIQLLKEQGIVLIIARIDSENLAAINALEDSGFRIKDIHYTWRHTAGEPINDKYLNSNIIIRPAVTEDILPVSRIAQHAFDQYGHYFADQRLDKDRCREIYPDWAASSITNKRTADHTLVAVLNEKITGFISIKIAAKDGEKYSAGGLGAVSADCRGQNIFASLVISALRWGQESVSTWQEHYSLAVNYPVNRVLTKVGFRQVGSFITLHGWLDR
jgi:predicted GNAT family N-acyltransferase